jgi:hypothetical protein
LYSEKPGRRRVQDFGAVFDEMPSEHPCRQLLSLLDEAIRRDVHFIDRHPTTLFQCLWNSCWWFNRDEGAPCYEIDAANPQDRVKSFWSRLAAWLKVW